MRKVNLRRYAAAVMAAVLILGGCGAESSSAPVRQAAPAETAAEDAGAAAEAEAPAEESRDAAAKELMEAAA